MHPLWGFFALLCTVRHASFTRIFLAYINQLFLCYCSGKDQQCPHYLCFYVILYGVSVLLDIAPCSCRWRFEMGIFQIPLLNECQWIQGIGPSDPEVLYQSCVPAFIKLDLSHSWTYICCAGVCVLMLSEGCQKVLPSPRSNGMCLGFLMLWY